MPVRKFKFIASKKDGTRVVYNGVTTVRSMVRFLENNGFTHATVQEHGKTVGYWNKQRGLYKA